MAYDGEFRPSWIGGRIVEPPFTYTYCRHCWRPLTWPGEAEGGVCRDCLREAGLGAGPMTQRERERRWEWRSEGEKPAGKDRVCLRCATRLSAYNDEVYCATCAYERRSDWVLTTKDMERMRDDQENKQRVWGRQPRP